MQTIEEADNNSLKLLEETKASLHRLEDSTTRLRELVTEEKKCPTQARIRARLFSNQVIFAALSIFLVVNIFLVMACYYIVSEVNELLRVSEANKEVIQQLRDSIAAEGKIHAGLEHVPKKTKN